MVKLVCLYNIFLHLDNHIYICIFKLKRVLIPVIYNSVVFLIVPSEFLATLWSIDVPSKSRAMKEKPFVLMYDFPAKV